MDTGKLTVILVSVAEIKSANYATATDTIPVITDNADIPVNRPHAIQQIRNPRAFVCGRNHDKTP